MKDVRWNIPKMQEIFDQLEGEIVLSTIDFFLRALEGTNEG